MTEPAGWEPLFLVDHSQCEGVEAPRFVVMDAECEHVCECRTYAAAVEVARILNAGKP